MDKKNNKSRFTQKNAEKEIFQSPEEMKLKKLEDIVQKLRQAVEKGNNFEQTHQEQSKRNATNKSNFSSPTSTRMKEDRSDREFLSNFMNIDEKNVIPPAKMHLLTDNDTSQNITARNKFQNLSDLMMDDKNITEFNFIRNSEDRVKLQLYTAFSKKSKEIFMTEKHPKQSKNQLLFHKINDIHIPKFSTINNEINKEITNTEKSNSENKLEESNEDKEKIEEEKEIDNNEIKKEEQEKVKDSEDKRFQDIYFRKENKGYFHIPSLIKVSERQTIKKDLRKQRTFMAQDDGFNPFKQDSNEKDDIFWDPEIDSDTLSYINHNFICIEDIYNKKNEEEKYDKNKSENNLPEEDIEPHLTPIMAKEILSEKEGEINNNFFDKEGKGKEKKSSEDTKVNNKFIEFIAINVGVAKQGYQVMNNVKSIDKFNNQLKSDFDDLINKYMEIDNSEYPKGTELTPRRIERFLRFKFMGQISRQIDFSLEGKSTKESGNKNDSSSDKNEKEKNEEKNFIYLDNESENNYDISVSSKEINQKQELELFDENNSNKIS